MVVSASLRCVAVLPIVRRHELYPTSKLNLGRRAGNIALDASGPGESGSIVDHCGICGGNHATETCDTAVRMAVLRGENKPMPDRPELDVGQSVGNYRL